MRAMTMAVLFVPAMLAGCSPEGADAVAQADRAAVSEAASEVAVSSHSVSGLPVVPLTVESRGKSHNFAVEVASTEAEQAKGLMFRTEMAANEGMIFPRKAPAPAAFWMRNTVIPLDIIFIGPDRRILNIGANARPYDETPVPSTGPVIAILELNGGRAAELGLAPGDKVSWKEPGNRM